MPPTSAIPTQSVDERLVSLLPPEAAPIDERFRVDVSVSFTPVWIPKGKKVITDFCFACTRAQLHVEVSCGEFRPVDGARSVAVKQEVSDSSTRRRILNPRAKAGREAGGDKRSLEFEAGSLGRESTETRKGTYQSLEYNVACAIQTPRRTTWTFHVLKKSGVGMPYLQSTEMVGGTFDPQGSVVTSLTATASALNRLLFDASGRPTSRRKSFGARVYLCELLRLTKRSYPELTATAKVEIYA